MKSTISSQPVYYLLKRKILFAELLIEYNLAFFISMILGYLIQKIKSRKIVNNNIFILLLF